MMKKYSIFFFIICASLLVASCGGRVELFAGVTEIEANEALAALINGGIHAEKSPGKEGMVSLNVGQSEVAKAIAILNAEGLPQERYAKMGDVFRKEGLISSPLEERARYLWALSQELSATISQIDGVVKARVHVVLPERSSGGDPAMPSSAAVFIKHKPDYNLDDVIPQVKRLVSNSIPGLTADKVTVITVPSIIKSTEKNSVDKVNLQDLTSHTSNYFNNSYSALIWSICAAFIIMIAGSIFFFWKRWLKSNPKVVQELKSTATES